MTGPDVISRHVARITAHLSKAKAKHPRFPTRMTWMNARNVESELWNIRKDEERDGDERPVEELVREEFYESLDAILHGDTDAAIDELYDCVAVLLRAAETLKGRKARDA